VGHDYVAARIGFRAGEILDQRLEHSAGQFGDADVGVREVGILPCFGCDEPSSEQQSGPFGGRESLQEPLALLDRPGVLTVLCCSHSAGSQTVISLTPRLHQA